MFGYSDIYWVIHYNLSRYIKFTLKEEQCDKIFKIISNMKNSKTCGIDNIDSYCIKLVKKELTPVLTHIINLSIQNQLTKGPFGGSVVSGNFLGVGLEWKLKL